MLLRIRTQDDQEVEVQSEDLAISNLIKMLTESVKEENEIFEEIPLFNVSHRVFLKVLAFTRHYHKDPMKTIHKPLKDNHLPVQKWYMEFVSLETRESLYELLEAASYLDIEPLQDLLCARIASLIKGTECDELKKIFGLDYDVDGI